MSAATVETTSEAVARLLDQAEAEGFERTITDPAVLGRVAGIVAQARKRGAR